MLTASKTGRSYYPGKALSEEIRSGIIDTIVLVQAGGDYTSDCFLGNYSDVALT